MHADLETVYRRLPVPLQHVACSWVGWRTQRTRYGRDFHRILSDAEARTYWTPDNIVSFRERRIKEFVSEAAAALPFYRERLAAAGASPSDIQTLADLSVLPVLTKTEVQEHLRELVSARAANSPGTSTIHTSGTTGGGLQIASTLPAVREQWAIWWRYRGWHGIRHGTWCALFAGRSVVPLSQMRPPFWRVNIPGHQVIFSGYHMGPENLPSYLGELRRRQVPWLHGYPSLLTLLAGHLIETNFDLGYAVRWITTAAESLLPHQSDLIEKAFGVAPVQHYGLAEAVANVSECELGTLHVDEDFAAVEFAPLDEPDLYAIVGTNFSNRAMPLIRYDSQDVATLREAASCGCGRPGRVVDSINGRREDYVVLRDGTFVGRLDHIFKHMTTIREAQIHQTKPGEMTIRIVRGRDYTTDDEQALRREAAKRVGVDMSVSVEYLPELPRSSIGKLRLVVSEIAAASIEGQPGSEVESVRPVSRG